MTVNNASMLTACDPGCITCSSNNPSKCLNCSQGYVLKSGVCLPCPLSSNCQTCAQNNSARCISCFPNDFLNNVTIICESCTFPCLTCASINQLSYCTSCPAGYSLSNGICTSPSVGNGSINSGSSYCGLNCGSCVNIGNTYTCKLCLLGSVLSPINGSYEICLPCLTGCSICSSSIFGICLSCFRGNYLDTSNGYICTPCNSNCFNCTQIDC